MFSLKTFMKNGGMWVQTQSSNIPARSLYFWEVKMSKSSSNFGWYWDLFKLNGHMIKHGLDWVGKTWIGLIEHAILQISCTKWMYQMCESLTEFLQRICYGGERKSFLGRTRNLRLKSDLDFEKRQIECQKLDLFHTNTHHYHQTPVNVSHTSA